MRMPKIIVTVPALGAAPASARRGARLGKGSTGNRHDLLAIQKQVQKVLPKCMAATVTLQMGGSSGSGVLVSKEGLVLTASHVSGKPGRAVKIILADGRELKGKALGMNGKTDSGLVRYDPLKTYR